MPSDVKFMQMALALAEKGRGTTSPNPMVGAVLVKSGKVIAQGFHKRCGGDHAEVVAFKKAGEKAKGATLYVTLEPCSHFGRTPPCVDRVIKAGVKRVVIAMKDPNPLTNGKSIALLRVAGIPVTAGVLEKQARDLNEVFIKYITKRTPFVTAKFAQTLDGKIATRTGDSRWITDEATRNFARKLRNNFDAILVGINTVLKDNPRLNAANPTKRLKKIVVDSALRTPLTANLFKGAKPRDCFIAVTKRASVARIRAFTNKGINVFVCPQAQGRVDLKWFMKQLAKWEVSNVLIEGGAHVVGKALKQGLVDKLNIYVAPKIIGDQKALSSVVGLGITKVDNSLNLHNVQVKKINKDLFITGYVYRNH